MKCRSMFFNSLLSFNSLLRHTTILRTGWCLILIFFADFAVFKTSLEASPAQPLEGIHYLTTNVKKRTDRTDETHISLLLQCRIQPRYYTRRVSWAVFCWSRPTLLPRGLTLNFHQTRGAFRNFGHGPETKQQGSLQTLPSHESAQGVHCRSQRGI